MGNVIFGYGVVVDSYMCIYKWVCWIFCGKIEYDIFDDCICYMFCVFYSCMNCEFNGGYFNNSFFLDIFWDLMFYVDYVDRCVIVFIGFCIFSDKISDFVCINIKYCDCILVGGCSGLVLIWFFGIGWLYLCFYIYFNFGMLWVGVRMEI